MNLSPKHYRVKIRGAVIDEGEVQPDLAGQKRHRRPVNIQVPGIQPDAGLISQGKPVYMKFRQRITGKAVDADRAIPACLAPFDLGFDVGAAAIAADGAPPPPPPTADTSLLMEAVRARRLTPENATALHGIMESLYDFDELDEYIDDHSGLFVDYVGGAEQRLEYTACHLEYVRLVEARIAQYLALLGATPAAAAPSPPSASRYQNRWEPTA